MTSQFESLSESSALFGANAAFIEDLYEEYLTDPEAVGEVWRVYFDEVISSLESGMTETPHSEIQKSFLLMARKRGGRGSVSKNCMEPEAAQKQASVLRLINSYRVRGHQHANIDPLGIRDREVVPDLELGFHGLGEVELDVDFNTGSLVAPDRMSLRKIHQQLLKSYGGKIGLEYMHIIDTREKRWIQKRIESVQSTPNFNNEQKTWFLKLLTASEGIEKYLHNKYVGQKRFSLEGAESLIVMLDDLIQRAGTHDVKEAVIGMAHRGRLNVLVNILGKPPELLFREFEGKSKKQGSGDVKYHQGFSSDIATPNGAMHVALSFNPSHLEIVDPVVQGSVRARQQRRGDKDSRQVIPILIHGDAAFSGQGVIMETFSMSQARGYKTGGTVHIVINNQIGFTTSNPLDSRSTSYCTEVSKMVQAPIFHVNGDDPEAVVFISQIAMDYCMTFKKDVVIDMYCYRRHGHNEADEPAITQPLMYKKIRAKKTTRELYAEQLVRQGVLTADESRQMVDDNRTTLDRGESISRPVMNNVKMDYIIDWSPFKDQEWDFGIKTRLPIAEIQSLSDPLLNLPDGFEAHPRVLKMLGDRRKMIAGALPMDWGCAETLAFASLLKADHAVRISGQDSGRGTFSHRHAVLHNQHNGEAYIPLKHIKKDQGHFIVIDSLLSEEAVLGFEYGYSSADPFTLVIWEAQFGDFANGAQVVIDQFISSGEVKWGRLCGLTMLLPHGYEGQGPEHSSARLERYLQLCAEHNVQICIPSTPAQVFHMIRRQMVRPYRKPLIVMTGKSLLRHKQCISTLEDLSNNDFLPIISETKKHQPKEITKAIFCSGKVYYDILQKRDELELNEIVIIRLEQLYPFPKKLFIEQIDKYPNLKTMVWCQEEPQNQGAWDQLKHRFQYPVKKGVELIYAGRPASASPAVGVFGLHVKQQEQLVNDALLGAGV